MYLLSNGGTIGVPPGTGAGVGMLICPAMMPGAAVGIKFGARVPFPVIVHCGARQQGSSGSATSLQFG